MNPAPRSRTPRSFSAHALPGERRVDARRGPGTAGFSLIELLIVIAMIAMIGLFAVPSVSNAFRVSLNASIREMASVIKDSYNTSMMTKKVHRLVYDLKEHAYYVEYGPSNILMDTEESKAASERRNRMATREEAEKAKEKEPSWMPAKTVTRKIITLPRGVEFEDVQTEQTKDPITEGKAYTHFFPYGMIEQTIIHLRDSSNHRVTLVIMPMVGRTRLYERYVSKEEILGEMQ